MEKTNQELVDYVIKMRMRGDNYRSIMAYLQRHCENEETVNDIIQLVDQLEKTKKIKPGRADGSKPSFYNMIFGILFIVSGVLLTLFLWQIGFIWGISLLMIGIGIWALMGGKQFY
jgi:hypothetical protein